MTSAEIKDSLREAIEVANLRLQLAQTNRELALLGIDTETKPVRVVYVAERGFDGTKFLIARNTPEEFTTFDTLIGEFHQVQK